MAGTEVEQVLDSSRYFVLRITDASSGRHAYIGMGFQERGESFDFQVALQDWVRRQRPKPLDSDDSTLDPSKSPHAPKQDFSLKEGETLTIKIGAKGGGIKKNTGSLLGSSGGSGGGGMLPLLPPPPSAPRRG